MLLREHGKAYQALCDALERGEGVGGCVVAIEAAIDESFGRNGELPAQTRARKLATLPASVPTAVAPPATADGNSAAADGWRAVRQGGGGSGAAAGAQAQAPAGAMPPVIPPKPPPRPEGEAPRPNGLPRTAEADDIEDPVGDFLEERRYQVARRLDAIKRQLGGREGEDPAPTADGEDF